MFNSLNLNLLKNSKNFITIKSTFHKFALKRNFDQYLIRPKRHFVLTYKFNAENENTTESN